MALENIETEKVNLASLSDETVTMLRPNGNEEFFYLNFDLTIRDEGPGIP